MTSAFVNSFSTALSAATDRTDFSENTLHKTVAESYKVRIFYCDIEIGDAAFNECIYVNHAIHFPVELLCEPVPDRVWGPAHSIIVWARRQKRVHIVLPLVDARKC